MKTDVIIIANDGSGMEEALRQAEKMSVYKELSRKDALHLRLLTEETLGMMRSLTGTARGEFWIEDEDREYRIHLKTMTNMTFDKKDRLLEVAGSGKNEAAKGIMGKIRTFFDPLGESPVFFDLAMENTTWSMSAYRTSVQSRLEEDYAGAAEAWDELEKSVVQNLADDVKVYIDGRNVEMVIIRKMGSGM